MQHYIFIGVDVHERTLVLRWALDRSDPRPAAYSNNLEGRLTMIRHFKRWAARLEAEGVLFGYEASCWGYGLYDQLEEAGFECKVLAPTGMPRSVQRSKNKTDGRDAGSILDLLRAHVLAGCELPEVWVPDARTRDDREVVRARLDLADKRTALKNQVHSLLKRNGLKRPRGLGSGWTNAFCAWLRGLTEAPGPLGAGAEVALATLLVQLETIQGQIAVLDREVERLSETERYGAAAAALKGLKGVGLLTAMVFLTEIGDMSRFSNRRQIGSYLGLAPSSYESGEAAERKGHITRHGPSRVRRVLCQATWSRVRDHAGERVIYERICAKNPKHKKKAVVAIMRRLGVRMWHVALDAQQRAPALQGAALQAA